MKTRLRACALGALLFLGSADARAEGPATDPAAAAEDLFRRAMQLMAAKRPAEACPLLAESYRLDPGGGTLQNLAVCYEAAGRWASAYARFQELRVTSKSASPPRPDRVKLADEHLEKVTPLVSRVILVVPSDVAANAEAKIDGVVYRQASWSTGIAVDPGPHEIVVEATGKQPWRSTITTPNEGGEQRVTVPPLADEPRGKLAAADPARDVEQDPRERERERADRALRTTGFIVGGAGLAVLVAGGVFGVLTIMKNEDGKDQCRADGGSGAPATDFAPNGRCYEGRSAWQRANDSKDTAETFANVANVLIPVGAIAAGIGTWLVLSHPSARERTSAVRITPALGGAVLQGRF